MSTDPTAIFNRLRPRLQSIGYRMLGSMAEAEDLVQDAWLRWHSTPRERIDNDEAWLVSVTTRLAIDRLRAAKLQREHYIGTWLPEPVLTDAPVTPEQTRELADDVSVAFLLLLERLAPEARAAFLLREVFDADYPEVARAIGKSEAACRQIVHRAKARLAEQKPRFAIPADAQHSLLRGFAQALSQGDFQAMQGLLAENAELIGDGGGVVPSFGKPLLGARRIAQLFYAVRLRHGDALRIELARLNGEWALLRFIGGTLESAHAIESDGQHITRIHVQRNPAKLARLAAALRAR